MSPTLPDRTGHAAIALPSAPPIAGLLARAPDPAQDLPAVAELITAANVHDRFDYIPTAEQLDHQWRLTPGFEPARDGVLVEIDGRLAGLALVTWREKAGKIVHRLEVVVRPENRRRRIGTALLLWAEQRARASVPEGVGGPAELLHFMGGWAGVGVPGVAAFLARHGYAPIRYHHLMVRDLGAPIADLPLPAGLEVRPVREADHRAIWDADVEAFRDHFDFGMPSDEDYVAFLSDPDLDTALWQVAWDGPEVAGSVINVIHPHENAVLGQRRGWLDGVSVRRAWRNRGLASRLVGRSLIALRDHGLTEAALGVDSENPTGALRVYERTGFVVHRTMATYRKPLSPTDP